MFRSKKILSNTFSLISCTVLLAACSGGQSSLSQGNNTPDESAEVTADAIEESSFDYETLYADDFEVTNNFKYKEYPTLDIDKIDLDRVNEDLLAFIVADLGLKEDVDENESEVTNNEVSEKDVAVVEQDDEVVEEVANEESGNPEAADNNSTALDEAVDEIDVAEQDDAWQEENGEVVDETIEDDGWVEGKGYPWSAYIGEEVAQISIDPETSIGVPHLYNPASEDFRYFPLLGESGLCPAEYCIPPRDLPSTAFFGEDGYIYDTEYAGTWEYYIDDVNEWTFYAWNHF
ncbi:hypothetical protein ACTHQ4_04815 [Alkalicoccobacillus gibsonii]|uniref:hypothetical protein n=1 Tax=Alkalicoccobacillus gibsonii TaxID=79881 RepID=UPI003F7BBDE1